jgi:hypothetical protein
MTGIFFACAVTVAWLIAAGSARATRIPPPRLLVILGGMVAILAIDGFNSLAYDLEVWTPYQPSNALRLATGTLGGVALGVLLTHLLAATLWVRPETARPVVAAPWELAAPFAVSCGIGALASSGLPILYGPVALGLVVASVGVFAILATVALALACDRGWTYDSPADALSLAVAGLVAGVVLIASLSAGRLILETWMGLPKLT